MPNTCQPIASLGFWASSDVPLSAGASSLNLAPKKSTSVALPSMPLDEELKVRDRLAMARELAEVGDGNIRWDLIIEEAARMSCGLKVDIRGSSLKKAAPTDDEDLRSTSASGSGRGELDETEPEIEVSSSEETEDSGRKAMLGLKKLPPWRRSRTASGETPRACEEEPRAVAATPPPWRRAGAAKSSAAVGEQVASTRVYTMTTMLQCWLLMQQSSGEEVVAARCPDGDEEQKQVSILTPPPGFAPVDSAGATSNRTSHSDAPWRRRPRAASALSD